MKKVRVIIESPLNPKTRRENNFPQWERELARNVAYARACMRDSAFRGEAPYASHLLLAQDGVLDDTNPIERAMGIEIGLVWGEAAELSAVYTDLGISHGMKLGILRADTDGRRIETRNLPAEIYQALCKQYPV